MKQKRIMLKNKGLSDILYKVLKIETRYVT